MAGTQYTNIWTTRWQTVLKMLLSFVTLWVVLQGNVPTEVDRTTGAGAVLRPVTFFVALASRIAPPTNSAMQPQMSDPQDLHSQESVLSVSTVGKSVTWSDSAPIL